MSPAGLGVSQTGVRVGTGPGGCSPRRSCTPLARATTPMLVSTLASVTRMRRPSRTTSVVTSIGSNGALRNRSTVSRLNWNSGAP